ncbi:MAG: transposase [Acidobacteriota bacterium]|nr:transposase [Acidobacteriota bacterium]
MFKTRSQDWLRYERQRSMAYYERRLPHWHPEGKAVFLTWRLNGSLPASFLFRLSKEPPTTPGRTSRMADVELDKAGHGPSWLKDPRVARCVVETIERGASPLAQYALHAFVVMANHVHLLLEPHVPIRRITDGLKGVSARNANRILGRTGQKFWQSESFDHWVRNEGEFERIRAYIENNPVTAELATKPEDWPWSSATRK